MNTAKPLRVWCVVVGEPSPVDGPAIRMLRTGLLARTLARRGHNVTWFNGTVEHRSKKQRFDSNSVIEGPEGVRMAFLHGRLYEGNVSFARILNHRDVANSFLKLAATLEKPDVIVCSYPPIELAHAVNKYASQNGIPCIQDLRDMWPDIIVEVALPALRTLARILLGGWFACARKTVKAASGIVGISRPFLEWGLRMAGREKSSNDRVFHLATDPEIAPAQDIAKAEAFWDANGITSKKAVIVFSGMLSRRYDLETVVRAARMMPEEAAKKMCIVLCGNGEAEETLRQLAHGLDNVFCAGWCNLADIQVLSSRACAGLLPYFSTQDFAMAFPNKVGEYLSYGLPIVSCLKGEVSNLIQSQGCGLLYEEGNVASCAKALTDIAEGRVNLAGMSEAAKHVYASDFDAKKIYEQYADYVESISRK